VKDISGKEIHMTPYEKEALIGVIVSQYLDGEHPVDRGIYTWDAIDNSGLSKKVVSGVWSSLVKKGWIRIYGEIIPANQVPDERTTEITAEGYHAIIQTEEGREAMIEDGHIPGPRPEEAK